MPISFDSALGIHQQALALRSQRAEILASNIANADTPGYKARDIDFKAALENASAQRSNTQSHNTQSNSPQFNDSLSRTHALSKIQALSQTNAKHIQMNTAGNSSEVLYRVPNQSSLDGNTVDGLVEKSAFAENALRYQASITFLDGKFKGMIAALKGE